MGRLLKAETPIDSTLTAEAINYYDNNGNVIRTKTKNGSDSYAETQTTYNWRNAPVKVLTDGTDSAYYYDGVGNVLRLYPGELADFTISGLDNVTGASYNVTKYAYDSQNIVKSVTDALGNSSTNTYDITGNLVKTVDRNGNILNYTYDELGRLTEKSAQATAEAEKENVYSYAYDKLGRQISMTGGGTGDSWGRACFITLLREG